MPVNTGETYNGIMEELLRSALGSAFPGMNTGETGMLFQPGSLLAGWQRGVAGYKKTLQEEAASGSKALADQRALGLREIEKGKGATVSELNDSLTAAGLNRSGVAANSLNKIYESESDAKNDLVTRIAALDEGARKDALTKLLGIEQTASTLGAADRQSERDIFSLLSNLKLAGDRNRMMQDELDLKKLAYEEGKTGLGGVIGSILGSLLGITSGGLAIGAGDRLNDMIFGTPK